MKPINRFFVLLILGILVALPITRAEAAPLAELVDAFDLSAVASFDEDLGLWKYEYTFTASDAPHGLSHWWLELPTIKAESIQDPSSPDSQDAWDAEYPTFGEPLAISLITNQGVDLSGGHSSLEGIKWGAPETSDFQDGVLGVFSFYSSHAPSVPDAYTWFAKFGRSYDYGTILGPNNGGGLNPPLTHSPEPSSLFLLGLGGISLLGRLRKRNS